MKLPPKKTSGQVLRATDWNALIDAVAAMERRFTAKLSAGSPSTFREPATACMMHNATGGDLDPGQIVGISDQSFTADQMALESRCLEAVSISGSGADEYAHKFGVVARGIGDGLVGPVYVSGVVRVTLNLIDGDHIYAKAVDNDALESAECGVAQILWTSDTAGEVDAIIRFPVSMPERIEIVIPPITCEEDGGLSYDTKYIWVPRVEPEEGSGS